MRLFELITTKFNKIDKEFTDDDNKSMDNFDSSDISVGTTAKVDQVDNDHTVKKTYHSPTSALEYDAYYSYIKQIADNDLSSSNPFFPRVYNVDIETDNSGRQKPIFDIEKLVPGEQINNNALYAVADALFNNIDELIIAYTKKGINPTHANMNMQIGRILSDIVGGGGLNKIKSKKLVQSIELIQHMIKNSNGKWQPDVHFNNIMYRQTSYGPQLVLTDPIK